MLTYDRWHQINDNRKLSKRYDQFWPKVDVEALEVSGDLQRRQLGAVAKAGHNIVNKIEAKKAELENDSRYTDEGRRGKLLEHFAKEAAAPLMSLREEIVAPAKATAAERYEKASAAIPKPQTPLEVAMSVETWRMVREGKLGYADVSQMSAQVQQAVAFAPPELVGMPESSHALIRKSFTDRFTTSELTDAEDFGAQVAAVDDLLDHAQVAAEVLVGIEPDNPQRVPDPRQVDPKPAPDQAAN